jgi:hypothetical protein
MLEKHDCDEGLDALAAGSRMVARAAKLAVERRDST